MTRDDYRNKAKDIMIQKNPYGSYHKQNFDKFKSYGEMAPINAEIINNMPNSIIVLSEDVYDSLLAVQDATNSTQQEFPFFLYGKENDNNVEFDEFYSSSANRQNTAASFDQNMRENLQKRISGNLNNGLVICHGHSHPPIGSFHQNFSLGDFTSYIQMNQDNEVFKDKKAELISCLVTSTGDINFVFYDNASENFYRFINVFVKDKDNNLIPINCYGLKQAEKGSGHTVKNKYIIL